MTYSKCLLLTIAATLLWQPQIARAQNNTIPQGDLMPSQSAPGTATGGEQRGALEHETHPPLNLSPDKSELVRLPREAASVVVGNPTHATVLLDTPRLAVVVPRQAGATYFSVLDKDGEIIMQRHVLVASPKKNYVRIRRSCGNSTDCRPTSVYFCPDMCHEIDGNAEQN